MSNRGYDPQAPDARWRDRFQYHPPWKATHWGFGFRPVNRGGDEWGNPSLYFILPLLGTLVIFYGKNFERYKWFLSGAHGRVAHYISPDYKLEAWVHFNGDFDALFDEQPLLTDVEINVKSHYIEYVGD